MLGEMGTELSLANLKRMPAFLLLISQVAASLPLGHCWLCHHCPHGRRGDGGAAQQPLGACSDMAQVLHSLSYAAPGESNLLQRQGRAFPEV